MWIWEICIAQARPPGGRHYILMRHWISALINYVLFIFKGFAVFFIFLLGHIKNYTNHINYTPIHQTFVLSKAIFRHRNSHVIHVIRRVLYCIYLLLINLSFKSLHQVSAAPSYVPVHTQIAPVMPLTSCQLHQLDTDQSWQGKSKPHTDFCGHKARVFI